MINTKQNTSHSGFSHSYVLRNLRPDNEYGVLGFFFPTKFFSPLRPASEQLHFLHWFPSLCSSNFLSRSSNFGMSTRCFMRNLPFKWKTGMSYLYLSYQAEFSGSVISTSCRMNCGREEICQFLLDTVKQNLLVFWAVLSSEMQGCFPEACGFILCVVAWFFEYKIYGATTLGCLSTRDSLPSPEYSCSTLLWAATSTNTQLGTKQAAECNRSQCFH